MARRYAFSEAQLGHWPEAEQALRGAVERDPEDEAAQALYGQVLYQRGSLEKARAALDNGIAVDPFDPALHATYAAVAEALKDEALLAREKRAWALATGAAAKETGVKEHHE